MPIHRSPKHLALAVEQSLWLSETAPALPWNLLTDQETDELRCQNRLPQGAIIYAPGADCYHFFASVTDFVHPEPMSVQMPDATHGWIGGAGLTITYGL